MLRRLWVAVVALALVLGTAAAACMAWRGLRRWRLSRGGGVDEGVVAYVPPPPGLPGVQRDDLIFVSVASYRDADCAETLRSMFDNARDPWRVVAGVCEQNSPDPAERCAVAGRGLPERWLRENVRRIRVPHTQARGPTYARYLCSTLARGEAYYCQVDSHSRFVRDWDAKAVAMLRACPSPRAVLTHYPRELEQYGSAETDGVPVLCRSRVNHHGVPVFEAVIRRGGGARRVPFVSGGFVFARGEVLREVPLDPDLPHLFQGEEVLYSARLWTSGYDAFTPTETLVYHRYGRHDQPKFWDDLPQVAAGQRATLAKVRAMLAGRAPPGYAHGMGGARPLDDYWTFAGIDLEARTSDSAARFC